MSVSAHETRLYQSFEEGLSDSVAVYQAVCDRLAADWPNSQQSSSPAVPSYLKALQQDVQHWIGFGRRHTSLSLLPNVGASARQDIAIGEGPQVADLLVSLRKASTWRQAKKIHDQISVDERGLFATEYADYFVNGEGASSLWVGLQRPDGPARVVDQLAELGLSDVVQLAIHASCDDGIYRRVHYARTLEQARNFTESASSAAAAAAMRVGMDEKVLKRALGVDDPASAEGQEIILEYGSTPAAQNAMLGALALRQEGGRAYSTGAYVPPVDDYFVESLIRERLELRVKQARQELHRTIEELKQSQEESRQHRASIQKNIDRLYDNIGLPRPSGNREPEPDSPPKKPVRGFKTLAKRLVAGDADFAQTVAQLEELFPDK